MHRGTSMLSPEIQYLMYAGTKKEDFTGWEKTIQNQGDITDCWSLDIGEGYFLDRLTRRVKRFLKSKDVKIISIRRDCSVEDPEGPYRDIDVTLLVDVRIIVTEDAIKLEERHGSFVLISREPVDWTEFEKGKPEFKKVKDDEDRWSSFYG